MAMVGWRRQSFQEDLVRSKPRMFCDRNETMMMQNARTVRRSVDANEQARERAKTTPLRNEAQLNCVALRSQLLCGDSIQHGRELALGGLNTRKTDKKRGCCGSTALPVVAPERS